MPEDPLPSPVSEQPTLDQAARHGAGSFGRYRLLQRLGEGGMGEVWLASQTDPVHREVALKVIKAGMDSAQVVARFEAERQALALMDHSTIATVFDGGTTPEGRPYFAMEYIRGEPITIYCDRHRLTTRERLELLTQVCDGVQHAHQKGIIHRDLKPSNVLVTIQDDRPVPKIIDFGVAKATGQHLTERSLYTELGVLIGTPEYMSPEQAEMGGLDIDTRTDIYALGVLLYELLTGALPFDHKELRQAGLAEIHRIIREKEPPRPSTRITRLGHASAETARNRHTEPRRLISELRGDLDWITMRALEKDRTRRYQTANALAMDIRRHLNSEPVLAGPPSATYRARKFVRRHRLAVAALTSLVLLLATFAGLMAVQARRIARERDKAGRLAGFMVDLFKVPDPSEARGNAITAREILDKGADRITSGLHEDADVKTSLMDTMSRVYDSLGLFDKARPLAEQALELRKQSLGSEHVDVAASLFTLARILYGKGDYAGAEGLHRQALEMRRRLRGNEHLEVAESLLGLANVLYNKGDYPGAESLYREALAIRRKLLGNEHRLVAHCLMGLGNTLYEKGDYAGAEAADREALALQRKLLGNEHPDVAKAVSNLASVLYDKGDYPGAEALYREALELGRKLYGKAHPSLAIALYNVAVVLQQKRDYTGAEALLREALAMQTKLLGNEHPAVADTLGALANTLHNEGDHAGAEALYREALAMQRKLLGSEHPNVAWTLDVLAEELSDREDFAGCETLAGEALALNRKLLGNEHAQVAVNLRTLGDCQQHQHKLSEAEAALRESLGIVRKALPSDHLDLASSLIGLGDVLTAEGQVPQAEQMLREGIDVLRRKRPQDDPSVGGAELALGSCLTRLGRFAEAESMLLHAYGVLRTRACCGRESAPEARKRLVELYNAWGKPGKAHDWRAGVQDIDVVAARSRT
jgi:tetratricopeptide (TPR) repeat protein